MAEPDPLRENLTNIAADLLSFRKYQPIVRRIFAVPAGVWQSVANCCSGADELPRFAAEVFADHAERFVVTHLPWPGLTADDPYRMVLFVHGDDLWSTIAIFNRASLAEA